MTLLKPSTLPQIIGEYIAQNATIAIAVSGGGDSMALLLAAHHYIQNSQSTTKIVTLTVDHNLREDSANEALQVQQWCKELNIEQHILTWNFEQLPQSAIQEKARNARYQLMGEFCNQNAIEKLFVGHNLEDNAETFLMRLKRGAGLKGLASISPAAERKVSGGQNIQIVRPFLKVSRQDLRLFLQQNEQSWIDDVSNKNEKFERVQIRNFLTDTDILQNDKIAQSATRLARADEALEFYTEQFWEKNIDFLPYGMARISAPAMEALPEELQLRLLARLVWTIGGLPKPTRWQKIENLQQQLQSEETDFCLGNCLIVKKSTSLWFGYEGRDDAQTDLLVAPHTEVLWQNRLQVKNTTSESVYIGTYGALDEKIAVDEALKNCPQKILKNLPIFMDKNHTIFAPHNPKTNGLELILQIRR